MGIKRKGMQTIYKTIFSLLVKGKWRGMQLICGMNPCNGTNFITQERLEQLDQVVLTIDRFISNSHLDGNFASFHKQLFLKINKYNVLTLTKQE